MSSIKLYPPKPEKVYFYGTCLVDMFYPEAGMAGIQLLEREGIEVIFPQDQTCCGQPAYTSGYHDQAREVAAAQLKLFPQDYPIVLPSGSCAGMMREHYPELFAGQPEAALAENVASRIYELTEFLLHVCHMQIEDKGEPIKVAMHTSCSARREMGLGEVGPALLKKMGNVEVVEQARIKECCGFGGAFSVRHPEISEAMVNDKVKAITDTGAQQLVSGDCGCLMNIMGANEFQAQQGLVQEVKGEHIASFLWRRSNES
ncbi:L-lactate dehydrogenase complex protein LldE [Oceanospirillum multiglobuliferum]|uniref:Oxidoreductase n=1 Tax=Oceanospirillum multiglobuliferum TaxID=64969 RepID=A0A1T4QPE3_9GAMM|nr:(Fe-S)-binding protein [Oceanospirillum multiglobuliferum]OPX56471.1 oxidoreductase [Oceanospirillum multiglobuliferum]SKA05564.1 L-lactate dehydrogenase complex protein LldE [Oceanospirillum multiglobuliferum]